jgi:hypothetical protein
MTYRPSSELPERPRAEIETDAHIEGNLATEVSFIILDTLERIVQVRVLVKCTAVLETIMWLSWGLRDFTSPFKMITNVLIFQNMRICNENGRMHVLLMVHIVERFATVVVLGLLFTFKTTWLGPVPWCRQLIAILSPQMPGFNPRTIKVMCVVDTGVLAQVFITVLWFFPVIVISPVLHTHLLIHYKLPCMISARHSFVKQKQNTQCVC